MRLLSGILFAVLLVNGTLRAQEVIVEPAAANTGAGALNPAAVDSRLSFLGDYFEGPEAVQFAQELVDHFANAPVTAEVSDTAASVMTRTKNAELRVLAATLFAAGPEELEIRSERLLQLIAARPDDYELSAVHVDMFTPDRLQEFVVLYAANPRVPIWLRGLGIQRLAEAREPGQSLKPEAEGALRAAALIEGVDDRRIDRALGAWDRRPLSDSYRMRAEASFKTWLTVWLIAVFLLGPIAFFTVFYISSKYGRNSVLGNLRTGWIVFSVVFFVLGAFFLFALYGFGMSHGGNGNPDGTAFWVPFVYLASAIIWGALARQARPGDSSA